MKRLVLCIAALAASLPAQAQEVTTARELRALNDKKADAQVREDLDAMLENFSGYNVGRRINNVGDVWIWTKPRASQTIGMCEKDMLQIFYAATGERAAKKGELPIQARSIQARRYYGFLKSDLGEKKERLSDQDREPNYVADRKCRMGMKDGWDGWFSAPSHHIAVQATEAFRAAKRALDLGLIRMDECNKPGTVGGYARCERIMELAQDTKYWSRVELESRDGDAQEFLIDAASAHIRIKLKRRTFSPTAQEIEAISVMEYIVVT